MGRDEVKIDHVKGKVMPARTNWGHCTQSQSRQPVTGIVRSTSPFVFAALENGSHFLLDRMTEAR